MSMMCKLFQVDAKKLNEMIEDPLLAESVFDEGFNPNSLDLEKSWQVIHFLLTGSTDSGEPPLSYAVAGHRFFDEGLDVQISYLTPEEVKQVARALDAVTETEIRKRYIPKTLELNHVYPFGGFDQKGELENYLFAFKSLVAQYRDADKNNNGMVIHIG